MKRFALIAFLCLFVCNGLVGQNMKPEAERSIILLARAWQFLDKNVDSIWPGWKGYKQKTVFIGAPGSCDLFINSKIELPGDFIQINDTVLNQAFFYRDSSHMKSEMYAASVFVDGISCRAACVAPYTPVFNKAYVEYLVTDYKMPEASARFSELLNSEEYYMSEMIHEMFHLYQLNNKRLGSSAGDVYIKNPKVAALSYIEGQLLMDALYSDSVGTIKQNVHWFLAVRHKKQKLASIYNSKNEDDGEWLEGCATYVQFKSLEILLKNNREQMHNLLNLDSLTILGSIRLFGRSSGEKFYYYGLAEALILDKLCGNEWKSEIMEDGVYLQDLLSEYSEYDEKSEKEYFENALGRFQYDLLYKSIKRQFRDGDYFIESDIN